MEHTYSMQIYYWTLGWRKKKKTSKSRIVGYDRLQNTLQSFPHVKSTIEVLKFFKFLHIWFWIATFFICFEFNFVYYITNVNLINGQRKFPTSNVTPKFHQQRSPPWNSRSGQKDVELSGSKYVWSKLPKMLKIIFHCLC